MTTNTTDQQLVIPDYPESADGPLDFFSFATGGLESRLVKRYLSAADRTARNPTPQTGELSFRIDAAVYESYNGTTWAVTGGKFAETLVKGLRIVNAGAPIATTSGATELDFAKYQFTGLTGLLQLGQYYIARYNITYTKTVAGDSFDFKLRTNTAVSGSQIGLTGFNPTETDTGAERTYEFIFVGDPTINSLFFSATRSGGTGTLSYYGLNGAFNRGWAAIYQEGDSSQWTDVA